MTEILQFALLGLGAGAIYALLAQGLVIIYKGTGVLNFAQGAFAMAGAYLFFELRVENEWATAPAFVASVVVLAILGVLTHLLIMRKLRTASTLAKIIATLGVLAVLQGAASLRYGSTLTQVPNFLPSSPVAIAGVNVGEDRFWLLGIASLLTAVLFVVGRYTNWPGPHQRCHPRPHELVGASLSWASSQVFLTSFGVR